MSSQLGAVSAAHAVVGPLPISGPGIVWKKIVARKKATRKKYHNLRRNLVLVNLVLVDSIVARDHCLTETANVVKSSSMPHVQGPSFLCLGHLSLIVNLTNFDRCLPKRIAEKLEASRRKHRRVSLGWLRQPKKPCTWHSVFGRIGTPLQSLCRAQRRDFFFVLSPRHIN